jgi:hypothetical protein
MTLILAIPPSGFLARGEPVWFALWFVPTILVVFALAWTGRLDRLLPAALATLIVGLWPVYRWLADGDARTASVYLGVAGMIDGMLLLTTALEFARRRGWVVDSPVRRRIVGGFVLAAAASSVLRWPTGVWHTGLLIAWMGVSAWGLFWPARRRPSTPSQPVTT